MTITPAACTVTSAQGYIAELQTFKTREGNMEGRWMDGSVYVVFAHGHTIAATGGKSVFVDEGVGRSSKTLGRCMNVVERAFRGHNMCVFDLSHWDDKVK